MKKFRIIEAGEGWVIEEAKVGYIETEESIRRTSGMTNWDGTLESLNDYWSNKGDLKLVYEEVLDNE